MVFKKCFGLPPKLFVIATLSTGYFAIDHNCVVSNWVPLLPLFLKPIKVRFFAGEYNLFSRRSYFKRIDDVIGYLMTSSKVKLCFRYL